ncbi:retrotransposable element ORF2 protein [Plecturocebus cupreus]
MWHRYTMEYYAAIKNDEFLSFVGTWMNLEAIILSKLKQEQKIKHHMLSFIGQALSPRVKCSGTICSHRNLHLSGSSDPLTSASSIAGITGMHHLGWLIFCIFVEMGFCHVAQAGHELLASNDPPTSLFQSAGMTGMSHHPNLSERNVDGILKSTKPCPTAESASNKGPLLCEASPTLTPSSEPHLTQMSIFPCIKPSTH